MDSIWTEDQFLNLEPFYEIALADIEDRAELRRKDLKLKLMAKAVGFTEGAYKEMKAAYYEEVGKKPTKTGRYDDSLARFHEWSKNTPTGVIDDAVREQILEDYNLMLINGKIYLYRGGVFIMDDGEVQIAQIIKKYIYPKYRTAGKIRAITDLLRKEAEILTDRSELNDHPAWWVNVKNGMLDLKTLELHEHDPKYKSINQIPWTFSQDKYKDCMRPSSETAKFLQSLIKDPENLEMFLQYAGYCMTTDMSLQRFMIIRGEGGTGKSVLLRMVERMVGKDNCCNMTLQNLNSRFAPAFLAGKLLNVYADLSSMAMEEANGVKTITGGDTIQAEYKGGDMFFFRPYCKLLFSANTVPKSLDDKTSAYYRRLLILPVEKRADEIDDLEDKLKGDAETFFHMCVASAWRLYNSGGILISGASNAEANTLYRESDSVRAFLEDCMIIEESDEHKIERSQLHKLYTSYCYIEDRTPMSRNGFYKDMREKGFQECVTGGKRFFSKLHPDYKKTALLECNFDDDRENYYSYRGRKR